MVVARSCKENVSHTSHLPLPLVLAGVSKPVRHGQAPTHNGVRPLTQGVHHGWLLSNHLQAAEKTHRKFVPTLVPSMQLEFHPSELLATL